MPLGDYSRDTFTYEGKTRDIYRRGDGPAVIIVAEVPGITPRVTAFADRVMEIGCTAVMPHLFGTPGEAPSVGNSLSRATWACVSREFVTLATKKTSPVTEWLRALARDEHERCGGPGVGAVGMCLTGGFALAMMVEESVVAPVLSQPSLPYPVTRKLRSDLGVSEADLEVVKKRAASGVDVLGLRFSCDRTSPAARFRRLQEELGDAFVAVEIDSSKGNPHNIPQTAHSVLTEHFVDSPDNPTRDALDQVLGLFRRKLLPTG